MSLAESFNDLQSRFNDSPSLREIFEWVEWQSLREAVSESSKRELNRHPYGLDYSKYPTLQDVLRTGFLTVREIQDRVCMRLDITFELLTSTDRHHFIALARHVAIYLCRKLTAASLFEIARAFCLKDSSTVCNAVKRIELMRAKDPKIDALLVELGSPHPSPTVPNDGMSPGLRAWVNIGGPDD
jgi:hypothetical protein